MAQHSEKHAFRDIELQLIGSGFVRDQVAASQQLMQLSPAHLLHYAAFLQFVIGLLLHSLSRRHHELYAFHGTVAFVLVCLAFTSHGPHSGSTLACCMARPALLSARAIEVFDAEGPCFDVQTLFDVVPLTFWGQGIVHFCSAGVRSVVRV